jgi:glycosyltransferase involved in cell wall biosynthesis
MQPKFSIITITYNAAETIERTIESIVNQTYKNIEYIIIDGASTDDTLKKIEPYKYAISYIVSEKDKGLYDAMNKGLRAATGDYVWFINSGDEIATKTTLDDVTKLITNELPDVIYGDTLMTSMDGEVIGGRRLTPPEKLTWKSFRMGMLVSHQAFIAKRALANEYDISYRFSADFDWCVSILKRSRSILNTHMTLARFLDGGITKQNIAAGLRERFRIMVRYYGLLPTIAHHIPIAVKFFFYLFINKRY